VHAVQLELQTAQVDVDVYAKVPDGHPVEITQLKLAEFKKYGVGLDEHDEQFVALPLQAVQVELQAVHVKLAD